MFLYHFEELNIDIVDNNKTQEDLFHFPEILSYLFHIYNTVYF